MTPPRRRGRSVPPKGRSIRPATPAPSDPILGSAAGAPDAASAAPEPGAAGTGGAVRGPTRSQNRAAKRATGVRPKAVGRGRVTGRRQRSTNTGLIAGIIGVFALGVVGLAIAGGFGGPAASPSPAGTPAATRLLTGCPTAAPAALAAGEKRKVTIETTKGTMVIEVSADLAPVAAANFIALAECGYYDGVIFHRVIPNFVVQGGDGQYGWIDALDRNRVGSGDAGYEFDDEPVVGEYTRGAVVMANSGPDTNGSQFFICVADLTDRLDKDYVLFGHVTDGMDVADQIVAAPRNAEDLPDDPVAMTRLTVAPVPTPAPPTPTPAPPSPGPSPSPAASAGPSSTP